MSLNVPKMGISLPKTPPVTTPKTTSYIQTNETKTLQTNLAGEPPKDVFVKTPKAETNQEAPAPQAQTVNNAATEKIPTKALTAEEEKKLVKKLKKHAEKGKLTPPSEEDKAAIKAMPVNDALKKDLRELLDDAEKCSDAEKYNKEIKEILEEHGI